MSTTGLVIRMLCCALTCVVAGCSGDVETSCRIGGPLAGGSACTFTNKGPLPAQKCVTVTLTKTKAWAPSLPVVSDAFAEGARLQAERMFGPEEPIGSSARSGPVCSGPLWGSSAKVVAIESFDRDPTRMCRGVSNCEMRIDGDGSRKQASVAGSSQAAPEAVPDWLKAKQRASQATPQPVVRQLGAPAAKWNVSRSSSPMGDEETTSIQLESTDRIDGAFGRAATPALIIRCAKRKLEAYVDAKVPLDRQIHQSQYDTDEGYAISTGFYTSVRLRYDDEKPASKLMLSSDDGDAAFFSGVPAVVKKMSKSKRLLVELSPLRSSTQVVTFDLTTLASESAPLWERCKK